MTVCASPETKAARAGVPAVRPRLLLHVCCGVCAIGLIEALSEDFDPSGYWYNPNIHPYREYQHRLGGAGYVFLRSGRDLLVDDGYDLAAWMAAAAGARERAERCAACYRLRLERTAREAADRGIPFFSTTLAISPHQDHAALRAAGEAAAAGTGTAFVYRDCRPLLAGAKKQAAAWRVYRQNYCGCLFSEYERSGVTDGRPTEIRESS